MTVIWGSTMFVSPDGRRFHCLFYVEATHWTLVSRSLPLNSSPGCSLSAVDRHQVVWFVYLIKRTPKKEQSFLTRDVKPQLLLIWFSFRLWLMSLFVLVAFPPLGRERRPPPKVSSLQPAHFLSPLRDFSRAFDHMMCLCLPAGCWVRGRGTPMSEL